MALPHDDPAPGYRTSLERLKSAQKTAYGAPAYSRFVNRPIGRRIAALAHVRRMTPNQVTAVSAALSATGIALLVVVPPSWPQAVAVAVLLALGYASDSADGQLARLRGGGSPEGEWLDHTVDMGKLILLHGAVLVAWLRYWPDLTWQWALVPILFAMVSAVSLFGWLLVDLLRRSRSVPAAPPPASAPILRSLLRAPSDYGLLCWLFVLWSLPVFPWGYGLLMIANAGILGLALPVWFRQAREIGRG